MEANWPMIFLVLFVTAITVYIGRLWFKRWFNPLSLYSAIWGFCLCTYEFRLIQFYPVSKEASFDIVLAWLSLYAGAGITLLFIGGQRIRRSPKIDMNRLKKAIIVLSIIGGVGVIDELRVVSSSFGGMLLAIFVNGNDIYREKLTGDLSWIPYIGAFLYAACSLAGVYTARIGKPTALAFVPLVLLALNNIFSMIRAGVIMALFLFLTSYLLTPREGRLRVARWQGIMAVVMAVLVFGGGFALVSSTRGLGVDFPGMTPAIDRISEYIPVFPSLYANLAAPPVAFSQYLATPEVTKNNIWGEYTFKPILRLLNRLGFAFRVPYLEESYDTPVPMNTATYLKNVYSDFGFAGIPLFPFVLGALATFLTIRIARSPSLFDLMLLSNIYLLILSSPAVDLMVLGDWYISLGVSCVAGLLIQRRSTGGKLLRRDRPDGMHDSKAATANS
ncbi:MAG TPA: O-antigen polymerase [Candidatus Acidoferrales bacterium]|nr:O-antigen polymerase [Candidatus Acidoferrales bacterium]